MELTRHVEFCTKLHRKELYQKKNTDGYLRFVDSPISDCRRLTQVGALPHPTLAGTHLVTGSKNFLAM